MSKGQKWLLSLACVCIMAIPFMWTTLKTHESKIKEIIQNAPAPKPQTSATGHTFTVPPYGKLADRDNAGKKVVFYNIGDKIIIEVLGNSIPEALYFQNVKEKSVRIKKRKTVLTVINLLGNHVRFKNFGTSAVRVRVTITPRKR